MYDFKYDILTIRMKDRNYSRSLKFRNFVADIDDKDYITGVRIFDASKVFDADKYILKKIYHADFSASVDDKHIVVELKFVSRYRNKILPLISDSKNFISNFSADVKSHMKLINSTTECKIEA